MSDFLALHHESRPLLMPNPWDVGSAKLLASLGFKALATTSSGFDATLGRPGGPGTREGGRGARRLGPARGGAGARGRDRGGAPPARLGRPRDPVRRRARGRGADRSAG